MKNYKTMYENIIVDTPNTIKEKIDLVYSIFRKEFIHDNNKHISDERNFAEWLRGLPSVITVPFYNHDILEKAKKYGYKFENEWAEDVFLEMYWSRLATSFINLKENL